LLSCENINFGYDDTILHNISLSIAKGEKVALLGANGSGKTTLSLILAGIIHPQSGNIFCDGISPLDESKILDFRRRIGYVFQNPEDGFVASDVVREIAFGAENFGIPADEIRKRVDELIKFFGLSEYATYSPLALSGGMKARLAIVSALATNANYIILDEPESFLDWRGKNLLINSLEKIEGNTGILHITQSADFAERCDKIFIIKDKRLRQISPDGIEPFKPAVSIEPKISDRKVLGFDNVSFAYENRSILKDVSFSINRGEIVGVVGESGAGKTTLAICAAGLVDIPDGKISRDGRISILFQFPERQLFAESVLDDVMFGPKNLGWNNPDDIARDALELARVPKNLWSRSPFDLSDGQQRKVGIAGVLATRPDILILDEPFASLDYDGMDNLFNILKELAERQTTIIIITHRTDLLRYVAPRTIALENGTLVFDGRTAELLENKSLCERIGVESI